jgi:hypothetical protein
MTHPYSPYHRATPADYQLHLDPTVEAEINALLFGPNPRLRNLILFPNWLALQPATLDRIARMPSPAHSSGPVVPRGAYHGTPRAADVGDLMKAIWAVPAVQQTANRLLDQVSHRAKHDWASLSTGGKAAFITTSGLILGGSLAGILSNNQARTGAFRFLLNKNIPVPGLSGLSVRMLPHGASFTYQDIAGSGVGVSAGGQGGTNIPTRLQLMVTLDVPRLFSHL